MIMTLVARSSMSSGISSGSGNSSRMDNDKQQAINNKQ
jgi:hypothetical protein